MSRDGSYLPALRFPALTRFYDPVVAVTTRERAFKRRVVELAAVRAGERVLDVGCGTGTLAVAIARAAPGAAVSGVDADAAMLARAEAKAHAARIALDLHRGPAQELPFADATFDVAVSSLFFHHLAPKPKRLVLAEIVRVLRPGGRLLIADWTAPRDPLMRVAAQGIRLLDGAESTADNLAGRLPGIVAGAGFHDVAEPWALRTVLGVLGLITAVAPGAPPLPG